MLATNWYNNFESEYFTKSVSEKYWGIKSFKELQVHYNQTSATNYDSQDYLTKFTELVVDLLPRINKIDKKLNVATTLKEEEIKGQDSQIVNAKVQISEH